MPDGERQPPALTGRVIGVTADRRAAEQIELLKRRGATCRHGPVLATCPLELGSEVEQSTLEVVASRPDLIVIQTAIGLRSWIDTAYALNIGEELLDVLESARLIVRGPKARGAASALGLDVEWTSPGATSGELLAHLATLHIEGLDIAVQLDGACETEFCDAVATLGARVRPVPVYRWMAPTAAGPAEQLIRSIARRQVDAVTFTARPAVERLVEIADSLDLRGEVVEAFQDSVLAACVGPICAESARRAGFTRVLAPTRFRLGSMVHMLSAHFSDQTEIFELAGHRVTLRGRQVSVDREQDVELSDRELRVLQSLMARTGAPCSKQALLSEVWNDTTDDTHAVEVTVARLRRRLGPAGRGIETVLRRGYRIV